MHAIELHTRIEPDGAIHLPGEYHRCFGQPARVIVLLPEPPPTGVRSSADTGVRMGLPQEKWPDPYALGEDLFDLGGPSSPPTDALKRRLWEHLHEKYGSR